MQVCHFHSAALLGTTVISLVAWSSLVSAQLDFIVQLGRRLRIKLCVRQVRIARPLRLRQLLVVLELFVVHRSLRREVHVPRHSIAALPIYLRYLETALPDFTAHLVHLQRTRLNVRLDHSALPVVLHSLPALLVIIVEPLDCLRCRVLAMPATIALHLPLPANKQNAPLVIIAR
jgi:hypothetical protein